MAANYDDERRFLAGLTKSQGPFFLIGFDENEQNYLLERARERLKSALHDLRLSERIDGSTSLALSQIENIGFELFDTQGWRILTQAQGLKKEALQKVIASLQESRTHWIICSSKKPEAAWQPLLEKALIYDVAGEKSWDKPKRLAPWVTAMAASLGLEIALGQAQLLVERLEGDRQMIKTQVEAVAAQQNYQGKFLLEQQQLGANAEVWKWLDDIWQAQTGRALTKLVPLLEEEPTAIPLAALVRSQWHQLLAESSLFENRSRTSSSTDFSASLTARAQKQQQIARRVGYKKLSEGALAIAKAQWDLKSSKEASETMQLLIVKLCQLCRPSISS